MTGLQGLENKLAYLRKLGAERQPHSGRTLYRHLLGTAQLLEQWGCSSTLCDVGLMHSVGGTRSFRWNPHAADVQADLSRLLDGEALRLIGLFSAARRGSALLDAWSSRRVVLRHGDTEEHEVSLSRQDLRALILVECANLIEQGRGRSFVVRLLGKPWCEEVLGGQARAFLERHLRDTDVALPAFSGHEFNHGYLLQGDSDLAASIRGQLAPLSAMGAAALAERRLVRGLIES